MKVPAALARAVRLRCFRLFAITLLLIVVLPLSAHSLRGVAIVDAIAIATLFVAATTIKLAPRMRIVALVLATAMIGMDAAATFYGGGLYYAAARALALTFYTLVIGHLLVYVFRRDVLTEDKLYGAAACFLLMGVAWAYAFSLVLHFDADAIGGLRDARFLPIDLLYFSFAALTTTGFGDLVARSSMARMLVMLEEIVGVLFVAILIARIAGVYAGGGNAVGGDRGD